MLEIWKQTEAELWGTILIDDDGDAYGDMELTLKEEVVVAENEENSESPAHRGDEDENLKLCE